MKVGLGERKQAGNVLREDLLGFCGSLDLRGKGKGNIQPIS